MINEFILVNTGYVTAHAKHTFKVDSTINDGCRAMTDFFAADHFNLKLSRLQLATIETSMYF